MQSASAKHRQRLLAEAFEQGIRHFDVARMYGLGAAEREVGRFARHRREQMIIATKFGIEPGGLAGRFGHLQAPARAVVARVPRLRRALKRRAGAFHEPRSYDAATLRASLETSLKELNTDYVDIFFVHDPAPDDILDIDELSGALEQLRCAGRVRAWGFAGDAEQCERLGGLSNARVTLQVRDDILAEAPRRVPQGWPVITFGVLSGALDRIVEHVRRSAERRARWKHEVTKDCGRPEVVAALLLEDACARNQGGTVLFSTVRQERIRTAVRLSEVVTSEPHSLPLRRFRELVRSELVPLAACAG